MTQTGFPQMPDADKRRLLKLTAGLAASAAVPLSPAFAQANSRNVPPAEWARIREAARKEGKIIVYGTMGPAQHERIVAAFNAANPGIKME